VGYVVEELITALEEYLCCNGRRHAVIIGVGALGRAIMSYDGFHNYGIEIVAAFDSDPSKTGESVSGKPVYSTAELSKKIKELGAELAVVCVPASAAESVCAELVECGIKAILNFAPVLIRAPEGVVVRHIDVAANLAILSSMI
jgi:redox-sensing transcriptional repressor